MNIQKKLDYPYYSKIDLDATSQGTFFKTTGPNSKTNITSSQQFDRTALVTMFMITMNAMKTDHTAWTTADLDLLNRMITQSWINFEKNGGERVAQYPLTAFLATVYKSGTDSNFDISKSVTGSKMLNIPALIPGGQSIAATLNWDSGLNLTGLTAEMIIWGPTDRTVATETP